MMMMTRKIVKVIVIIIMMIKISLIMIMMEVMIKIKRLKYKFILNRWSHYSYTATCVILDLESNFVYIRAVTLH